jgi:hypothetical protein
MAIENPYGFDDNKNNNDDKKEDKNKKDKDVKKVDEGDNSTKEIKKLFINNNYSSS